ncbi:hypothetical protein WA158_001153 [Blastocystis sp. Blastoise]
MQFEGLIKQNCEDFIVDEINVGGIIAKITNQNIPSLPEDYYKAESADRNKPSAENKQISELLSREDIENIKNFADKANSKDFHEILDIPSYEDKDDRTAIFGYIATNYPHLSAITDKKTNMIHLQRNSTWDLFEELVSKEDLKELRIFFTYNPLVSSFLTENRSLQLSPQDDKEKRTQIHHLLQETFPYIITTTNNSNCIIIRCKPKGKKRFANNISSKNEISIYNTQLTIEKNGIETTELINSISTVLKIPQSWISIAGIKDKKAVTTQYMNIRNVQSGIIKNKLETIPNISVGNFLYTKDMLSVGQLWGNQFTILIRDINSIVSNDSIDRVFKTIVEEGFPNTYGSQRVGQEKYINTAPLIGKYIIEEDYKHAIDCILTPENTGDDRLNEGLTIYKETNNIKEALQRIPKQYHVIIDVLHNIRRYGDTNDELVFNHISSLNKQIYVRSYQSSLFNQVTDYITFYVKLQCYYTQHMIKYFISAL